MWKNLVNSEKLVHSKFSITFWQRDKQDTDISDTADIDDNKITMNQISSLSNKKRRKLGF